jgi:hypothetical protein
MINYKVLVLNNIFAKWHTIKFRSKMVIWQHNLQPKKISKYIIM